MVEAGPLRGARHNEKSAPRGILSESLVGRRVQNLLLHGFSGL